VFSVRKRSNREGKVCGKGVLVFRDRCAGGGMELLCLGCLGMAGGEKGKEIVWEQKSQSRGERQHWLVLCGGRLREERDDGYLGLAGRRKRCWEKNGKWRWEAARLEKENVWWPGVCGDGEASVEKGKPVLWPVGEKNSNQEGRLLVRDRFRFRVFFVFFFQNCPLFVYVLETPIYR
jgi:hypothetical protein